MELKRVAKKSIWKHAENDVNTLARISLTRRQSRNLSNRAHREYISGEERKRERREKKLRLSIVSFPKDEPLALKPPFPFPSLFYECAQNCNAIKRFRLAWSEPLFEGVEIR